MSLKGFEEMTVAELHAFLTERGKAGDGDAMKWNTKTRKAELVTLAKEANRRKHADTNPERVNDVEAAEVYAHLVNRVHDEFPSVESAHRPIDLAVMGNKRERHAARMAKTKTSAVDKTTPNRIVRMVRASQSRRYGQSDRGLGAKHFSSGLHPFTGHTLPMGKVINPDAIKMLSYGDRVRHYTKQLGQPTAKVDGFPGPLLTPRQWRRIVKKDNRNKFLHRATKEARYM